MAPCPPPLPGAGPGRCSSPPRTKGSARTRAPSPWTRRGRVSPAPVRSYSGRGDERTEPGVGGLERRAPARPAALRPGTRPLGQQPPAPDRAGETGAGRARPAHPPAFLAVRRVVLSRRRAGSGDPVLPGPSPPGPARAEPDARGGGGQPGVVPAHPAPRGGPRGRERLPPASPQAAAGALRPVLPQVPRVLHAQALQQELRPPPGLLVRAEPPRRGLRGDLRGVDHPRLGLGAAVPGLEGAPEARVHGRAHEEPGRQAAAGGEPPLPGGDLVPPEVA